ncbi:MAG: hypothetical protein ACREJC_22310 [Tepidisphaeraceae bacterium]
MIQGLIAACLALLCAQATTGSSRVDDVVCTITVANVSLRAQAPRVTATGREASLSLTLENLSDQNIRISGTQSTFEHLELIGPDGKPVPMTPLGVREIRPFTDGIHVVTVGKSVTASVNLTQWFSMTQEGSYTIRITRSFFLPQSKEFRLLALDVPLWFGRPAGSLHPE